MATLPTLVGENVTKWVRVEQGLEWKGGRGGREADDLGREGPEEKYRIEEKDEADGGEASISHQPFALSSKRGRA